MSNVMLQRMDFKLPGIGLSLPKTLEKIYKTPQRYRINSQIFSRNKDSPRPVILSGVF